MHKWLIKCDLVARTDCPRPLRIADARLADHLPVELRKTPDKRQPESAAAQREEPWSERNTREIQQREVDSKKRQVGIQPSGSRSPGSGYGSERPGQKQSLLCRFGRAHNTVLHCREDTGPKSRDNGKCYCCKKKQKTQHVALSLTIHSPCSMKEQEGKVYTGRVQ